MYKVQLIWSVHLGMFVFDSAINRNVGEKIGVFTRDIEIPFCPYVGLCIQGEGFTTPKIDHVIYLLGTNSFICKFEDDVQIPNTGRNIADGKDPQWLPSELDEYLRLASSKRVDHFISTGWSHKGNL